MIDKQKIFDAGYLGLKAQGFERSVKGDEFLDDYICLYRSPSGMKCVLGFSIPDKDYHKDMEGLSPSQSPIIEILGSTVNELSFSDEEFLDRLQDVHDTNLTPDQMKDRMKRFADDWDLTIPENE